MAKEIVNRVARSGIITIDFEELWAENKPVSFDLAPHLWQGLALKEQDFREALDNTDWSAFQDKKVNVFCSLDAIIPTWAYMLVASKLDQVNAQGFFGEENEVVEPILQAVISAIPQSDFTDRRIVIKGCGSLSLSPAAYMRMLQHIQSEAKAVMYGEPCSTVPLYRKKR